VRGEGRELREYGVEGWRVEGRMLKHLRLRMKLLLELLLLLLLLLKQALTGGERAEVPPEAAARAREVPLGGRVRRALRRARWRRGLLQRRRRHGGGGGHQRRGGEPLLGEVLKRRCRVHTR